MRAGGDGTDTLARATAGVLLFASGLSALVLQVLWVKQLTLVVGVEVHAVALGVAAFLGGLALGGWLLGPRADNASRPLRQYAGIEAAIALLAVLATWTLAHAAGPFVWMQEHVGPLAWALPLLAVLLPAVPMGATLPVLVRVVAPDPASAGRAGGRLYAANTTGAVAGALLSSFALIPALGVRGTAWAAASLNLLIACVALLLERRLAARPGDHLHPVAAPAEAAPQRGATRALALYACAGAVALGYEVVWSQAIAQFASTRAFAFSVALATYLAALAIGSLWMAARVERLRDPWSSFALLIAGAGLLALCEFALLGPWLSSAQSWVAAAVAGEGRELLGMSLRFAVAALCMVFLPTLLLGAAFPVALRLAVGTARVGRDVGRVVALNTLGNIGGTLLTGFVLVPVLGLVRTLGVLAVVATGLGMWAVMSGRPPLPWRRQAVAAMALVALLLAAVTPPDRLARLLAQSRNGHLAFYEETRGGTVAVVAQRMGSNQFNRLYIQGVSNSGDAMTSLRYMRLQALLPLIVHRGEPKSALVVGLGTGITAGALLSYPGLKERVVAELLPAVVRAAPQFRGNHDLTHDTRMDIRVRDGRRELLRSPQHYDLVTLEPPPPSAAGVVNLYSSDFYQLAANRLKEGGLVAQWLPLPTQNDEDTRSLVRSFIDVFPHATLWTTELHEMLLLGSMQPLELDVARISQRFAQREVAAALGEVGIASPEALVATWVTDRAGLARYAGDALPVTDDRPRIEYASWVRRDDFPKVLMTLIDQLVEPPLVGADDEFLRGLARERQRLYRFYSAGVHAYAGDRDGWARDMRSVMDADPANPYYQWFTGGAPR